MQKFTIFTAILTVIIVVVVAEILVSNFFPSLKREGSPLQGVQMDVPDSINANFDSIKSEVLDSESVQKFNNYLGADLDFGDTPASALADFESDDYVSFSQNVFIREDQIKSAGFTNAYLEDESFEGYIFKNIYVGDLDIEVKKSVIRNKETYLAKVYVIQINPPSTLFNVYDSIMNRSVQGLNVEINETNEFGNGSFYMNDNKRSNIAFLTVKIGSYIYGFSYPKQYHSQISNLAKLIDLEL